MLDLGMYWVGTLDKIIYEAILVSNVFLFLNFVDKYQ